MNMRSFSSTLLLPAGLAGALCPSPAIAQTWSAGPSSPVPIVRAAGAWFAPNGRVYLLGGRQSDAVGSDQMNPLEYDPVAGTWTVKAAVFNDNQVCNMVAGVLNDGTDAIYMVGGSAAGASTSTPDVRRYDPATDSLTVITSDPWSSVPANTLAGGGAVYNNKLYVIGGFTIGVGMTTEISVFDPMAAPGTRWTTLSSQLVVPMGYVPCATVGNQIYIGAGTTYSAGLLYDSANSYVLDPVADLISAITPIPRATGETTAVTEGGQVWVLGGGRVAPNPSNEVDAYSPAGNSWTLAPNFATARRNFASAIDPATGRIYIVGGYAPATADATMEIFGGNSPFTPYCGQGDPALTTPCPCGVQGATGHGCENSVLTGGSLLGASGSAVPDSVLLSATGELPNALSIFLQGTVNAPTGLVFGTGVRCASGSLKRLYAHNASGGSVSAPVGTDLPVTVRSANLGDTIAPGSVRYYTVYYRDPAGGPGGCGGSTFNTSNGVAIQY